MSDRQDSHVTGETLIDKVLDVLHDWGYEHANLTDAEEIVAAIGPAIYEDEKAKSDLAISFWAHENGALRTRIKAVEFVCGERERELLELKGPCSSPECRLHYAHSGPCDIEHPVGAALIAYERDE